MSSLVKTFFANGGWDFLLKGHENIALVANELNLLATGRENQLKVLDVGCGNGALARMLNKDNIMYVGSDISSVAIAEAKINVPWATFFQSDIDEPIQSSQYDSYDVIVFCEVLIYVDYEKVLSSYSQLLNKDGLFIISLYDVWRTKIILRKIRKELNLLKEVYVKNISRNIGWTLLIGRIK